MKSNLKKGIEDEFVFRVYGKSELAMMYFPESSPLTALRNLKRWMAEEPQIVQGLKELGYGRHLRRKSFSRQEVEVIVKGLGLP